MEQLIGTYGFPIVACIAIALYVKYLVNQMREDNLTYRKEINEMREKYELDHEKMVEVITNNTASMNKLADSITAKGECSNEC